MKKLLIFITLLITSISVSTTEVNAVDYVWENPGAIFIQSQPLSYVYEGSLFNGFHETDYYDSTQLNTLPSYADLILSNNFQQTCFAGICIDRWKTLNIYGDIYNSPNFTDIDYFVIDVTETVELYINKGIVYSDEGCNNFYSEIDGYEIEDRYSVNLMQEASSGGVLENVYSQNVLDDGVTLPEGTYYIEVKATDPSYNSYITVNNTDYVEWYYFNIIISRP
jgi:hypothetical protein